MAEKDDPMAPYESFLEMLLGGARQFTSIGVPVLEMNRKLRKAIDAYRKAEAAGDAKAMAAAGEEANRLFLRFLRETTIAVITPSPGETWG